MHYYALLVNHPLHCDGSRRHINAPLWFVRRKKNKWEIPVLLQMIPLRDKLFLSGLQANESTVNVEFSGGT